jgi:hypothetical protein
MKPYGAVVLTSLFNAPTASSLPRDLPEHTPTVWHSGSQHATPWQTGSAEDGSIDDVTAHAIKDAQQTQDSVRQQEALAWLWVCCPDLADELQLPLPSSEPEAEIEHYLERLSTR